MILLAFVQNYNSNSKLSTAAKQKIHSLCLSRKLIIAPSRRHKTSIFRRMKRALATIIYGNMVSHSFFLMIRSNNLSHIEHVCACVFIELYSAVSKHIHFSLSLFLYFAPSFLLWCFLWLALMLLLLAERTLVEHFTLTFEHIILQLSSGSSRGTLTIREQLFKCVYLVSIDGCYRLIHFTVAWWLVCTCFQFMFSNGFIKDHKPTQCDVSIMCMNVIVNVHACLSLSLFLSL